MSRQKGNIVPVLLIIIVILAGVVVYFVYSKGLIKNPLQKSPEVGLKTEYKNPFQKESQYLNPFDENKNPFDVIGAEGHE